MNQQSIGVLLMVILLIGAASGIGVAQEEPRSVRGEPDLQVYASDPVLTPGETTDLVLQIANDGEVDLGAVEQREMVTTARSVTIEIDNADELPFTIETKKHSIGTVADGTVRDVPITISVPEDIEPEEYTLDVELEYSFTYQYAPQSSVIQERSRTVSENIDVTIDGSPRFELQTIDSDVQIGGSGTLVSEITNVGGETARDLTVVLESTSQDVTLGETSQNTARIHRLEPGENATIPYDANIRPEASIRNLTLTGTVQYTDPDGILGSQSGLSIGIQPKPEQEFTLTVNDSTLRVGETGTIQGTIQNDGPADVNNVVLVLGNAQFEPQSPNYSIGVLGAGESAPFRFQGIVPAEADAVPQQIDVTTQYRTLADNKRQIEDSIHVSVADQRDAVAVTAIEPEFTPGEEGVLELEISNQRDIEIQDVRLNIVVDEPLQSEFTTTVISSLDPGETKKVAFDLEVNGDAPSSQFPATVEVEYADQDNNSNTARTSIVAVTVNEQGGEEIPIENLIFGVLLVLVAAGAWWFYRR